MADPTFDGTNMIITLNLGGASHTCDVQIDLYSAWKRWMVDAYANQGFPPAFTTEGGFDVNPQTGLVSGRYFFLNNDAGWRIRPAEEDSTIYFLGNLLPTNFDRAIIIPTIGDFTVLVNGLQPITQIAPGSVSAQNVWDYTLSTGNTADKEVTDGRQAAETSVGVSV